MKRACETTSNPFRMRNSVLLTFFSTIQAFPRLRESSMDFSCVFEHGR
jgi:hypothetical protein